MKKLIALILASVLLVSFTACGTDDEDNDSNITVGEDGEINFPIIDAQ